MFFTGVYIVYTPVQTFRDPWGAASAASECEHHSWSKQSL